MSALKVISGGAAQGLVGRLAPEAEGTFGAVGAMKARLLDGAPCDVVILTPALITELVEGGHVLAASVASVGPVSTGIAVKSGDPFPAVQTPDDLRAAFRAAEGIYVPDVVKSTAGIHFMKVLISLEIADEMAARLRAYPNGATAMAEMVRGTGRVIGCTQVTEITFTPGVELVARLPDPFGLTTIYTAAVATRSTRSAEARALIDRLAAPISAADRRACGFD